MIWCLCVLFGWYHACWFVCPCVIMHACTSAPSGEIGPRAAGYHPMHRALINWLRSGPEWAVNICLWRIAHPSSLMCVKTGLFSWQRHSFLLGDTTWVTQDRTWPACFPLNCSQSISNWIRSPGPPMSIFLKEEKIHSAENRKGTG